MNIGLIDVDGHNFPNLALMRISAWHKSQGDTVEWAVPMCHYDIVYQSKIYSDAYSKDIDWRLKKLQRWCNNKFVFKKCLDFNDYNP